MAERAHVAGRPVVMSDLDDAEVVRAGVVVVTAVALVYAVTPSSWTVLRSLVLLPAAGAFAVGNAGRSDALNAALCVARHPYVCVIDADSLLEEDALIKVAKPILDAPDLLVATGGTIRVDARAGWSRLDAFGLISGAFGLFHRPLVEVVGGYWTDTVGEDFELTIRLHRHLRERDEPYRIAFVADPVCWTEVPEQFATLARQRRRWQRGLWEGMHRHRRMMGNPRYGAVGLLAMPYFLVFEFLSPVFALGGLIVTTLLFATGVLTASYFLGFIFVSVGLGIVQLLLCSVFEAFGYHQLHNVWRFLGVVDLLRGTTGWGAQERRGFESPQPVIDKPH